MYHIVYLTTNLVNLKMYVGVHSTYNLDDGYLGSGTILQKAIKKYGISNFKRQVLFYCLSENDAFIIESYIVDSYFIERNDTYNVSLGGNGSWKHVIKFNTGRKRSQNLCSKMKVIRTGTKHSEMTINKIKQSSKISNNDHKKIEALKKYRTGKPHSDECKAKMSNSHSGKLMHNTQLHKAKYIKLHEIDAHLQNGWVFGRLSKSHTI